jgi:MFS family permease
LSVSDDLNSVGYAELLRRNSNFRSLWLGQVVSLLGDWFNLIASATLIATLTQSGVAIGGLFVVRMLAPFLVSPIAGVAADRYNRKWLLIIADLVRALTVLCFLFVRSSEDVWLIYVLSAIQMGLSGFFFPTRNAILPDITSKEELGAANAISSATWSVMLALGAALGGLASGILGPYPAFIIDAFTFLISAAILNRITYSQKSGVSDKTIAATFNQYVEGLTYLRKHLDIFFISTTKAFSALFVTGAFQVLKVAITEQHFTIGKGGGISLGLMYMSVGIGTGIGPIFSRHFTGDRDKALRKAIILAFLISAIGLWLTSNLVNFPLVLIGTFLRGVGAGVAWVFSAQLLLQLVPNIVRGRVFSTEFMMWNLMNAIGAGTAGWVLDNGIGIATVLQWMAILTLLPAMLWMLWYFFGKTVSAPKNQNGT